MHELIPSGVYQGLPAVVLDGGLAGSVGPDWMRLTAGPSRGPFLLRGVTFPDNDVALERLMSSRAEAPLVWRAAEVGCSWPSTPVWTVLDLTQALAGSVGLDPAATRAALVDLPPMGAPDEVVVRSCSLSSAALDELHAYMDPRGAWLLVPYADVPQATRLAVRCVTPWGVRGE